MKLFECKCKVAQLMRLRRPWWLRVFPMMRLCFCRSCKSKVFMRRSEAWSPHFVYTLYRRRSHPVDWQSTRPMRQGRRSLDVR